MGKRTQFEELILCKALAFKNAQNNGDLLDMLVSQQIENNVELKNVCAKVVPQLADKLDEVCGLLSISKRRFIESALIEALKKADDIMQDEVDIFEHMVDAPILEAVEEGVK